MLAADRVDAAVSNAGHSIAARTIQRSLVHPPGLLNLSLMGNGDTEIEVSFNFHCESKDSRALQDWLSPSGEEIMEVVERLLSDLGLPVPEETHVVRNSS